jgi:hypothetical protein
MTAPEYRAARRVLLDALDALAPQLPSLILVGAQAIYLRLDDDLELGTATMTTDGDLAMNTELLSLTPQLAEALASAGFSASGQPGTWASRDGVNVDLMVCPHQSGRAGKSARAARLDDLGHPGRQIARITPGLEPALVDHSALRLGALDGADARSVELNVAGPAALIVAKLVKLRERMHDANSGRPNRVRGKDVTDILRILNGTPTAVVRAGVERHLQDPHAGPVSSQALDFLRDDSRYPSRSQLRKVLVTETGSSPVVGRRWDLLVAELVVELTHIEAAHWRTPFGGT